MSNCNSMPWLLATAPCYKNLCEFMKIFLNVMYQSPLLDSGSLYSVCISGFSFAIKNSTMPMAICTVSANKCSGPSKIVYGLRHVGRSRSAYYGVHRRRTRPRERIFWFKGKFVLPVPLNDLMLREHLTGKKQGWTPRKFLSP